MAFPDGWLYYSEATPINPTGNITTSGIPMLVDLKRVTGLWSRANSDLSDVRVALSDGTQLPYHIVPGYSVAAQSGLLVFRMVKTTSNQTVRIYYGNTGATGLGVNDPYGQYNVYNTGILGFYASGGGTDSTSYQRHATQSGTINTSNVGPINNKAVAFVPSALFSVTGLNLNQSGYTIHAWGYPIGTSNHTIASLLNTGSTTLTTYHWAAFLNGVGGSPYSALTNQQGVGQVRSDTPNATPLLTWSHGLATYSGTSFRKAYLSGIGGTAETSSRTVNPIHTIHIGANVSQSSYINGSLSLLSIYGYPVNDAEAAYHYSMGNQSGFWGTWSESNNSASVTGTGVSVVFGGGQFISNNNGNIGGLLYQNVTSFDAGLTTGYTVHRGSLPFSSISGDYGRRFKTEKLATVQTGTNYAIYVVNQTGGPVNVSTVSTKNVVLIKPNGDNIIVPASYITDGSNGGLYITTTGLNVNGKWGLYLQLDSSQSDRYRFEIRGN